MYALKNYIYAHVCICNLIYIGLMELYAKNYKSSKAVRLYYSLNE